MLKKMMRMRFLASFVVFGFGLSAQAATPKNLLVVAQIAEPKSMDPATVTAVNDFRILMNVYDGLVRDRSGTFEVEPGLAESWTISDDGKDYTFSLLQGIKFHDGSPFNAEAVKFNFDRMLVKGHPYAENGPFPLSFFFSAIKETTVVDEYTAFKPGCSQYFTTIESSLPYRADYFPESRQKTRQGCRSKSSWNWALRI